MRRKDDRGKRLYVFKAYKESARRGDHHDFVMEHCVIHGGVNKVVDQILRCARDRRFRRIGLCRMDWVDPRSTSARCS